MRTSFWERPLDFKFVLFIEAAFYTFIDCKFGTITLRVEIHRNSV